ncbi:hypothetical protein NKG94_43010 [Micromonospora sp. M12]
MVAVLGIVGTAEHGWTSPRTLGAVALAALLLGGFAVRQRVAAVRCCRPGYCAYRAWSRRTRCSS